MSWEISIYAVIVLGGAAITIGVGLAALRQRPDPLAWPLAMLMFAAAAWAIPHGISFGSSTPEGVVFWHRIRYPGTVIAPAAYLVFALHYAGWEEWLTHRRYAALAIIPVGTLIAVWTNPYHGLFWRSVSVKTIEGASIFVPEFGPWYWINLSYSYGLVIVSLLILALVFVRSGPIYRKQAGLLLAGGAIPLIINAMVNFGVGSTPAIDYTTTGMAVSGITFALALFHFDLLELRPVARAHLIDELTDGVIVVGPDGRIVDLNRVAARVLDGAAVGQPATDVIPTDVVADGGEIVVEWEDEHRRVFQTRKSVITDGLGRETGFIVYLTDVTALVEREQRISVLNRILQHNIRNELTIITGYLSSIEDRPESIDEHVTKASSSALRILEMSKKAKTIEQTLQNAGPDHEVSVDAVVASIVADMSGVYPEASVEFEGISDTQGLVASSTIRVVDQSLFEQALRNLIENAIIHNDSDPARVTVQIKRDDEIVHVRIADNGPGIPEAEQQILHARSETPLEHGSGLGLWLVKWTASLSSGTLSFEANEPRGSVVTLSFSRGNIDDGNK